MKPKVAPRSMDFSPRIAGRLRRDSAAGAAGAFALLPGFTYAVTEGAGETRVWPAPHL